MFYSAIQSVHALAFHHVKLLGVDFESGVRTAIIRERRHIIFVHYLHFPSMLFGPPLSRPLSIKRPYPSLHLSLALSPSFFPVGLKEGGPAVAAVGLPSQPRVWLSRRRASEANPLGLGLLISVVALRSCGNVH